MAWNPSPQVAAARDFGGKFGFEQVIILGITRNGEFGMTSWGKTKSLCAHSKIVMDQIADKIDSGEFAEFK